jgi:hypothetical protein
LLSSADAVFEKGLHDFLYALNLDNLPELIFRLCYILAGAYLLAGVFLHAATQSKDENLLNGQKSVLGQFLGFTESAIVLGSVAILFVSFVVVQFQYFFGGQANIHIDGYTYSEYARRGFGELVAVAFFSLLLILGFGAVTRRESETQRKTFSALSVGIVALVLVMLVSAYKRLVLYETAYGFSELRAYTHVFMIWLALLLVATVVFEIIRRERMFALAALIASIGFAATLPLLNVDAFIVRANIQRAADGAELDASYFTELSSDALPALVDALHSDVLADPARDALSVSLACLRSRRADAHPDLDWRSFHLARWQERTLLASLKDELKGYTVNDKDWPARVTTPLGKEYNCGYNYWMD